MSNGYSLQKTNSTHQQSSHTFASEYGGQQKLVCYANISKNLTPAGELNLAKDYNTKVNHYNKQHKPLPQQSGVQFDDKTRSTLKENLERINNLYKNNPTLKATDPITQATLPAFQERAHVRKTPLSDLDNIKSINNNPLSTKGNPNSKLNYETKELDWKPSQKSIQPQQAASKDLFEKRELKAAEWRPPSRNPITNEAEHLKLNKHASYGQLNNLECKKLLSNEYGQELKYRDDRQLAAKPNSYQSQERAYSFQEVNQGDFRKKQSEFENKNTFLRGK